MYLQIKIILILKKFFRLISTDLPLQVVADNTDLALYEVEKLKKQIDEGKI